MEQNVELARLNPKLILKGDIPRLIDEWQVAPNYGTAFDLNRIMGHWGSLS